VALEKVLSIAGHLPRNRMRDVEPAEWPEFGEYAHRKYPNELDEDEINMIEGLIERRKKKDVWGHYNHAYAGGTIQGFWE